MTPEDARKKLYRNFQKLSPEQRLIKALTTAWQARELLTPEQRRLQDAMRNGGKRIRQQKLAERTQATGSEPG